MGAFLSENKFPNRAMAAFEPNDKPAFLNTPKVI